MTPKRGEGAAKRLMGFAEEEVVNGRHTGRFWIHVPVEAAPGLIRDIAAFEASPSTLIAAVEAVDKLAVWCAVCQKEMKLVTGPNVVKGWYACEQQDSPCASHAVVISENLLRSPPTEEVA